MVSSATLYVSESSSNLRTWIGLLWSWQLKGSMGLNDGASVGADVGRKSVSLKGQLRPSLDCAFSEGPRQRTEGVVAVEHAHHRNRRATLEHAGFDKIARHQVVSCFWRRSLNIIISIHYHYYFHYH